MKKRRLSERAVDFILSRDNEELSTLKAGQVSKRIGANRSYLSRCFKFEHNIPLRDFISREKIYRALFILDKDHEKSIPELAGELGFIRVEDFAREFENQFAIAPERYRHIRKNKKNAG